MNASIPMEPWPTQVTNTQEPAGSKHLRVLRRRASLTQEHLSEMAGLHVRTVRGLESGRIRTPRLSTLELLSHALALDVRARLNLLAAWGVDDHAPLGHSPNADALTEDAKTALSSSRRSLRIVTLNERVSIDADRRLQRRTTQEVVLALEEGVRSRYVFYEANDDGTDITLLHLIDLDFCEVERELCDPVSRVKVFEIRFEKPPIAGETKLIRYTADFRAATRSDLVSPSGHHEEVAGFWTSPASYVLEVRFLGRTPPQRCWQVFQPEPTGPVRPAGGLDLTPANDVHLAMVNPRPGGHGIAWQWDSDCVADSNPAAVSGSGRPTG